MKHGGEDSASGFNWYINEYLCVHNEYDISKPNKLLKILYLSYCETYQIHEKVKDNWDVNSKIYDSPSRPLIGWHHHIRKTAE